MDYPIQFSEKRGGRVSRVVIIEQIPLRSFRGGSRVGRRAQGLAVVDQCTNIGRELFQ